MHTGKNLVKMDSNGLSDPTAFCCGSPVTCTTEEAGERCQPCRVLSPYHDSKIASTFASLFAASYTFLWAEFFPETPLRYPPSFDGRVVAYPSSKEIMDYFAWRQADSASRMISLSITILTASFR
jgi:hypothetical protein